MRGARSAVAITQPLAVMYAKPRTERSRRTRERIWAIPDTSGDWVRSMIGAATNSTQVAASVMVSTSAPCLPWRASRYARLMAPARPRSGPSVRSVNTIGSSCAASTIPAKLLDFAASSNEITNDAASTADHVPSPAVRRATRALPILARSVGLARSESPLRKRVAAIASTTAHTIQEGRSTCDGNERPRPASASMVRSAGPDPCASITNSGTTVTAMIALEAGPGDSGAAKNATCGSACCATVAITSRPHSGHFP